MRTKGSFFKMAATGFAAVVLCVAQSVIAQDTYVITGSGTEFTASKGGETVGTTDLPIQDVIDAIRVDAAGADCEIQFGNGMDTLDIGVARIGFSNGTSGDEWGEITLTGKLISSYDSINATAIYMSSSNINSKADILHTDGHNYERVRGAYTLLSSGTLNILEGEVHFIVNFSNNGIVNIYGGTVWGVGINGHGELNISGGTVKGNVGVWWGNATITISDNAMIISEGGYAIRLASGGGAISGGNLIINGGTVIAKDGDAITSQSIGSITINGGTVIAKNGYAVYINNSNAMITGGFFFGSGNNIQSLNQVLSHSSGSPIDYSGNPVLIAWNNFSYNHDHGYTAMSSENILYNHNSTSTAAWWDRRNGGGIAYTINGTDTGFIALDVTIHKADLLDRYDHSIQRLLREQLQNIQDKKDAWFYNFGIYDYGYVISFEEYYGGQFWNDPSNRWDLWDYTLLQDLTAEYGQTLSSVVLPDGWSWADAETTVGLNDKINYFEKHEAMFSPFQDTANFKTITEYLYVYIEGSQTSVLSPNRIIPVPNDKPALDATSNGSVNITAGPNPTAKHSGAINFFWEGRSIQNGTLFVYSASGNLVKKINITDKSTGKSDRRNIGQWDLKDSKGRLVSEGSYVVKGTITTKDGKREKVSIVLGVR